MSKRRHWLINLGVSVLTIALAFVIAVVGALLSVRFECAWIIVPAIMLAGCMIWFGAWFTE